MQHSRLAAFWTGAGVLATLAVLPYVFAIDPSLLAHASTVGASGGGANRPDRILLAGRRWAGLRHLADRKLKPLHICTYYPTTLR